VQIGLLEPDRFDPGAIARLQAMGHLVAAFDGGNLQEFLEPVQVLFVRLAHQIDADFVAQAPALRYVCSPTTGHTHLDESTLTSRGIKVVSLRGEQAFLETIRATPEHTFGLLLALLRNYRGAFTHVASGGWERDLFRGEELYGQRVGIVGLGRVGFRVASYCEAFGAHVSYVDIRDVKADAGWQRCTGIQQLIETSRIIFVCASFINGGAPVLGQPEIALLRSHYLINTARGELVNEAALLAAIEAGQLAGVATDVISHETGANQLERWNAAAIKRNVIITPHIGGATYTAMARTENFVVNKLAAELQGMEKTT
jgi:D-3-phosphoglycerate dehydrogenase / 2-oxoglutarate reductase